MSRTTKSPLTFAKWAYDTGKRSLPKYAHKFSRRDFTCPQLFAILALRKFFKTDYRGVVAYLAEWEELRKTLDLDEKLPHFTTPQKASAKLLDDASIRTLLTQTLEAFFRRPEGDEADVAWLLRIDRAAGDSTGFESNHCSRYYAKRRKQGKNKDDPVSYRPFPKLGLLTDCSNHLILATHRGIGPRPDVDELEPLLESAPDHLELGHLLLDAGYDSAANHRR